MLSSNLSTNQSKRFFTPIVASSLALFLSAGVANATAKSCAQGTGEVKICYDQNEGNPSAGDWIRPATSLSDLTWSGGDVLTPQAGGTSINQLIFNFNTGTRDPQGSVNGNSYSVNFGQNDLKQVIIVDGGTKGMAVPTLQVSFGTGTDSTREFHLNLSKATGDFAFKGNIDIKAGKGWETNNGNRASAFVGDFGSNVEGNITTARANGNTGNANGHRTTLTFTNDASLKGNLYTAAGITTATFENGSITGNISVKGISGLSNATNNITFKSADASITGDITASQEARVGIKSVNNIVFKQGGTINGNLRVTAGDNIVSFAGTTATINGNITSEFDMLSNNGQHHKSVTTIVMQSSGTNTITGAITTKTANNTISMGGATATITGNIDSGSRQSPIQLDNSKHQSFGNTITMTADTSTIKGNLSANEGKNTITFGSNTQAINTATLTGSISSNLNGYGFAAGRNILNFYATTATITGNISATSSTNDITFHEAGSTSAINGNISTNAGTNNITAATGTLKIGSADSRASISASGGGTATNNITAKTLELTLSDISAIGNGNGINTNNLTAGNATISITGAITTNTGSINNIRIGENAPNTATASTLTTGGVQSSFGTNTILLTATDSTFTSSGSITADSGTNNITLSDGIISVQSTTKAVANITASGGYTATNSITAKELNLNLGKISTTGNSNSKNTNNIIGKSGTITATLISADRGTNNIGLGGGNANGDSKLSGNIIADNSGINNIILEGATWETTEGISGSITSSNSSNGGGGVNNLVLRKAAANGTPYAQGADATYHVTTNAGANHIVLEGQDAKMQINYGSVGTTVLLFAGSSNGTDSFDKSHTDVNANKVLGKTYHCLLYTSDAADDSAWV